MNPSQLHPWALSFVLSTLSLDDLLSFQQFNYHFDAYDSHIYLASGSVSRSRPTIPTLNWKRQTGWPVGISKCHLSTPKFMLFLSNVSLLQRSACLPPSHPRIQHQGLWLPSLFTPHNYLVAKSCHFKVTWPLSASVSSSTKQGRQYKHLPPRGCCEGQTRSSLQSTLQTLKHHTDATCYCASSQHFVKLPLLSLCP